VEAILGVALTTSFRNVFWNNYLFARLKSFEARYIKKKCLAPHPPSSEDFFVDISCGKTNTIILELGIK
jgi:hypothetical protein